MAITRNEPCQNARVVLYNNKTYILYDHYAKLEEEVTALEEWKQLFLAHPLGETVVELKAENERLREGLKDAYEKYVHHAPKNRKIT